MIFHHTVERVEYARLDKFTYEEHRTESTVQCAPREDDDHYDQVWRILL